MREGVRYPVDEFIPLIEPPYQKWLALYPQMMNQISLLGDLDTVIKTNYGQALRKYAIRNGMPVMTIHDRSDFPVIHFSIRGEGVTSNEGEQVTRSSEWLEQLDSVAIPHPFKEPHPYYYNTKTNCGSALWIPMNWELFKFHAQHGGIDGQGGKVEFHTAKPAGTKIEVFDHGKYMS